MSSLTEQERTGLEEVFLSISSNHKHPTKLFQFKGTFRSFLKFKKTAKGLQKPISLLRHVNKRLKLTYLRYLLPKKR